MGSVTIDTTTDTIDSVVGTYAQTTGASRTINFQLIDADTLDVYYTGSNTASGVSLRREAVLAATATPLPTNQPVNLLLQNERSGGAAGVNGGGGQIEITRA